LAVVKSLDPPTIARLLRASAVAFATEVRALAPELARRRPDDGGWCALEVIGHIIESDRQGFGGRIRLMVEQDEPVLETWDQPAAVIARRDIARDPEELAQELLMLREEGARMLEGLEAGDVERGGDHPTVGWLTVGDVMHEWVHHDRAHLKQLLELAQDAAWPWMGNAQRFSD
jgi:DinB superfamily